MMVSERSNISRIRLTASSARCAARFALIKFQSVAKKPMTETVNEKILTNSPQ